MNHGRGKKKGLALPANLLSRIDGEGFDQSEWQKSHNMGGKRKSRKESRKELRQSKKMKRMPSRSQGQDSQPSNSEGQKVVPAKQAGKPPKAKSAGDKARKHAVETPKVPFLSAHELEMRSKDEEDARYYAKKLGLKGLRLKDDEDGLGDILGDLDVDDFAKNPSEEEGSDVVADVGGNSSSGSDSDSDAELDVYADEDSSAEESNMTALETMAKLAALKAKKRDADHNADKMAFNTKSSNDNIRIVREQDLGASDDSLSDDGFDRGSGSDSDSDADAEEMSAKDTMAKLAALKAKKEPAAAEKELSDDSLSEGDFESESESDFEGEKPMTAEETMAKLAALKGKARPIEQPARSAGGRSESQDAEESLSEGDFYSGENDSEEPEMSAEETMRKLAALKGKKLGAHEGGAESDLESEPESEDEDDENPYLPPSQRRRGAIEPESLVTGQVNAADSEATTKMRRVFKGALNRLTESTFSHVLNEIELTFTKNSRAEASEVLTDLILQNIGGSQSLQQSFFVVYGGLVAALYRSMGVSFAASFVQRLVEDILKQGVSTINYLTLLVECYTLHVVSSRLMYDLLKDRLQNITSTESEHYVEEVLVIVRNGGSLLRTDDPLALKEVILILQQRIGALGGNEALPPRMRFLVDTIVALKNNRQKATSELVLALRQRMRKHLQTSSANSSKEPLQVGLDDIRNSSTKGKWWLVGASWKGSESHNGSTRGFEAQALQTVDDDGLDGAAPDWLELAKKQRLNTDVRRAVFVALMGAEDYLDACLRIDKLGLKNKQERDIPHVILHCLAQEPVYNPYYALVAGKQCTRHSTRKTFQFRLFDWLDAHSQSQGDTQVAMHYGRFYASLVLQKVLGLDVLKAVDFLGASGDVQVFLEVFFVTLYRELGKQGEKDARRHLQQGLARVDGRPERDGRELTLLLSKCKEPKVLRGLQLVAKSVANSEAARSERDRDRIVWGVELASDMADEIIKRGGINEEL